MKTRFLIIALSIVMLAFIESCTKSAADTTTLYTPTTSDVTANATLAELQQGRTLYVNNCNSCHTLFSPDSYTPNQWKSILSSMAPKTSMSASEVLLVTKYVCRGNQ
jgi:cytochrome c5